LRRNVAPLPRVAQPLQALQDPGGPVDVLFDEQPAQPRLHERGGLVTRLDVAAALGRLPVLLSMPCGEVGPHPGRGEVNGLAEPLRLVAQAGVVEQSALGEDAPRSPGQCRGRQFAGTARRVKDRGAVADPGEADHAIPDPGRGDGNTRRRRVPVEQVIENGRRAYVIDRA
jgi:hypothetical protein